MVSPPPPSTGATAARRPQRANIVNSSGFYYTTRHAQPSRVPAAATAAAATSASAPPPPAAVPLASLQPSPTPVLLLQQQQQQQQRRQSPPHEALALPAPYDRPSSPPVAAPCASHPLIPHPSSSRSSSAIHWQLRSPQERTRVEEISNANHSDHDHHSHSSRGAVFEYASEAVNTLEQQYGDALQRLSTMHRLYDRLDEQNKVLEAEVVRLRRVNELLQKGIAFSVYNSVRLVKHEMKLLKQYVAVLCTGFRNSMEALQQVVAEDVPRLLGRDAGYTALLPFGAQGRLRAMETRVSVGRSTAQHDAFASAPALLAPPPSASRDTAAGAAETQVYQSNYWWNAMSPHPLRLPDTHHDDENQSYQPQQFTEADGAQYDNRSRGERGAAEHDAMCGFDDERGASLTSPPAQEQQQDNARPQDMVSFQAYRQVQTALAESQRRVVKLEQQNSAQQADYEARVAQLKVAHRAREARLEEELSLLKRIEPITTEGDAVPQITAASSYGHAAGGGTAATPVDINALAQLIVSLQQQQQQQQQPSTSAGLRGPASAPDNDDKAKKYEDVEDDGMVDSRDPHSRSSSSSSRCENADRGAYRPGKDSADDEEAYDFYYGNGDPRQSYERTNRRVLQAVALGNDRPHTVNGDDGRLHVPDRYSASAAVRRAELARQMLDSDNDDRNNQNRAEEATARGRRPASSSRMPHSLAYDRLVDRRDAKHRGPSSVKRAEQNSKVRSVSRGRSRQRGDREKSHRGGRSVDLQSVDPALLQAVLEQLSHNSNSRGRGGQSYASKADRARAGGVGKASGKADRLAQGLWAQELLKERHLI